MKLIVPCDPISELNLNYGNDWLVAKPANYSFKSLERKWTNWTDYEWQRVLRYYNQNGTIDLFRTFAFMDNYKLFPDDQWPPKLPDEPDEDDI